MSELDLSGLMNPTMERIGDLQDALTGVVTLRWATVTQTSPLRIRFDGEADPMGMQPATLVPLLMVGERVLCASQHLRATVLAAKGRVALLRGTTAQREALALSGVVEPGQTFFDVDESREYVWDGTGWRGRTILNGMVTLSPPGGGGNVTENVTFPVGYFADPPTVITGAGDGGGTTVNINISAVNVTASGFTANLTRSNGTTTRVFWAAIPAN